MENLLLVWNSSLMILLVSGMLGGVWITVFSDSWLGVWAGLELNLLCFIPFLTYNSRSCSEASVKYFLIQACGSFILLASSMSLLNRVYFAEMFIMGSLLLKMGAAPLHYWYPMISEEIGWGKFLTLSTLQKTSPLVMMWVLGFAWMGLILHFSVILSGLVGAMGGINEMSLRKMLAYSSINHLGWLLMAMTSLSQIWLIYFFLYCALVSLVVVVLMNLKIFHLNQLMSGSMPWEYKVITLLSLFSLGGMPPLLGFLPKWILIKQCILPSSLIYMAVMICSSVVTLFFYSRLGVSTLLMSQKVKPKNLLSKEILSVVGLISTFGFGLIGWLSVFSVI